MIKSDINRNLNRYMHQTTWRNYRGIDLPDNKFKEFKLRTIQQRIRKNNAEVRLQEYFKKNRSKNR